METKKEEEKLIASDIYNLAHNLMGLEGIIIYKHPWDNIQSSLRELSYFRLKRTVSFIGEEAQSMLDELNKKYKYHEKGSEIEDIDYHSLQIMLTRWRGRIDIIAQRWILSLPEVHLDTLKLVNGVKDFLSIDEYNILNNIEQQGLNEGASCLLHNHFTSSEFIILRSVESILRRWYEKRTSEKLKQERWGDILEKLSELYPKKSQRPKELSLLGYLRGRRNEIAHPEAISNSERATSTFLNAIAVCKAVKHELAH